MYFTGCHVDASNSAFDTCSPPVATLCADVSRHPDCNSVKFSDSVIAYVSGVSPKIAGTKPRMRRWIKLVWGNLEVIKLRSLVLFRNCRDEWAGPSSRVPTIRIYMKENESKRNIPLR